MQADLEFVQGDFGTNYDILIQLKDGSAVDLTNYSSSTLSILSTDGTIVKLNGKALTIIAANPGKVRWVMASGDTNYYGTYQAQIVIIGSGVQTTTFILS